MTILSAQVSDVAAQQSPAELPKAPPPRGQMVLVVDDSRLQRRILSASLGRWGYDVREAGSGDEALNICRSHYPDLIISDWMMPGMSGLDLCKAYRAIQGDRYGYFILLTSKSEKGEVAQGLDVGADDFLTKPVNAAELHARIRAGQRILDMERQLTEKNRLVSSTLEEMRVLYDAIDRDLIEARKLQQSLVREKFRAFKQATVSLLLRPAGHVGGDLVGMFPVNASQIGLYSIDVSGHGIASALMTARLAAYLSGNSPDQNIALAYSGGGKVIMRPPSQVAELLNTRLLDEMQTELYLTMVLARVDLDSGQVVMTQAGHPHPAVHRRDGGVEFVGDGGLPVGLIPGADYSDFELNLCPGDRLFLGSDGITECENASGEMLDQDGLAGLLRKYRRLHGPEFLERLMWDLDTYSGASCFADDISGILVDFLKRY